MAESKDVGSLAESIVHGTDRSPMTSATPAGPIDNSTRDDLADTLNQVFALFRLNYHNQFYAAYADTTQLNQIKRLWLDALSGFTPETILSGAKQAIENCEYLPSLKRMLDCCHDAMARHGIPDVRAAFLEACERGSPKLEQPWTHPVVYLAGKDSDWFFLANNPERSTFPVFEKHYSRWVDRISRGEQVQLPPLPELPGPTQMNMSAAERQAALRRLRSELDL